MEMDNLRALDHCEVFHQLSTEISDFDAKQRQLKQMRYWSGNEKHIFDLCQRVIGVLLEHRYLEKINTTQQDTEDDKVRKNESIDANQLRATMFFLVVNSDNQYFCKAEELRLSNPQCVHLMGLCPSLPHLATIAIAYKCGLSAEFNEFLACAPYWLTGQYLTCLNDTLAHLPCKFEALEHVCNALHSIAKSISHNAPQGGLNGTSEQWTTSCNGLLSIAAKLLQRHILISNDQVRTLPSRNRRRYFGQATTELLGLSLGVLHLMQSEQMHLPPYSALYILRSPHNPASNASHDCRPILITLMGKILDVLQNLMCLVSVNIFMYWQELPSTMLFYSLQEKICEQSYQLLQQLLAIDELSSHTIRQQLQPFADANKSFESRLSDLTLGDLLNFVDDDKKAVTDDKRLAGLNELFKRSIAFGNDECVATMGNHVNLLNTTHASQILAHLGEVASALDQSTTINDEEDDDDEDMPYVGLLRQVLQPIFNNCTIVEKVQLLQERDNHHQILDHFKFESTESATNRIRFFNNLSYQEVSVDKVLDLCYENPSATWLALAHLAMAHTRFATQYWLVARQCAPHAVNYLGPTVAELLQDERMLSNPNASRFLLQLYNYHVQINSHCCTQIKLHKRRTERIWRSKSRKIRCMNLNPVLLPYTREQLKKTQRNFITSCADALRKFTEPSSSSYKALKIILELLLQIVASDKKLAKLSCDQLRLKRKRLNASSGELKAARTYAKLHTDVAQWRRTNWSLTNQIILTVDKLRWNLTNFDDERVHLLGLAVRYVSKSMPSVFSMPDGFLEQLNSVVDSLQHREFWRNAAKSSLSSSSLTSPDAYVELLLQSSQPEARTLMESVIKSKQIAVVMSKITDSVITVNTDVSLDAFIFLFKCYLDAFKLQFMTPQPPPRKHCLQLMKNLKDIIELSPSGLREKLILLSHDIYIKLYFNALPKDKDSIVQLMSDIKSA